MNGKRLDDVPGPLMLYNEKVTCTKQRLVSEISLSNFSNGSRAPHTAVLVKAIDTERLPTGANLLLHERPSISSAE